MKGKKKLSRLLSLVMVVGMMLTMLPAFGLSASAAVDDPIYVNGTGGSDANDGSSEGQAVETIARAYELAKDEGKETIIVCGNTDFEYNYVAPAVPIVFEAVNDAKLKISGYFLFLQADTTFQDMTLVNTISNAQLVANGHTLTFREGFVLEELDAGGTGICIIGGGYYGDSSLSLNIKDGSNIVIKDGTFGSVYVGPSGYGGSGASTSAVECEGTYRIHVTGDARVRDLYTGANWEMPKITSLTLPRFEVMVDSDDVVIGNIWGGGYWIAPSSGNPQITQESTTINIEGGTIDWIFGGSLGGLYSTGGSYTIDDVIVNISGNTTIKEIYSAGVVIGTGSDSYSAVDRVEKMTIQTSIDLSGTSIYSNGDTISIGFGLPSANEIVETGEVEIILTGNGKISGLLVCEDDGSSPGEHTAVDAGHKTLTFDNGTFEVLEGFDELKLQNAGKGILTEDITIDKLSSDGNVSNTLIYQKDSGVYPVLTLNNGVNSSSAIVLDFIDEFQDEDAPEKDQVLITFADEAMADKTQFLLNASNTKNLRFYVDKDGADLFIDREEESSGGSGGSGGGGSSGNITSGHTITLEYYEGETLIESDSARYAQNKNLTATDLKIPDGYELVQTNFNHKVTGATTVKIEIKKIEEMPIPILEEKAYINGYLDGTFIPDGKITRAEVMHMLYTISGGSVHNISILDKFGDMTEPHWADNALAWAVENGYICGYENGNIMPNELITRAELSAVLNRITSKEGLFGEEGTGIVQLSDIDGHWASDDIMSLARKGVVSGYNDGTFKPNNAVTRAETVVMISKLFGRTDEFKADKTFSDVPINHWAYNYIMNAANGK